MKYYFKIELLEVDDKNMWHNVYLIIDTHDQYSDAMKCFLGRHLNIKNSEIKRMTKREFELKIQEEQIINEIQ